MHQPPPSHPSSPQEKKPIMSVVETQESITFKSQILSLHGRVKQLEADNAKLRSLLFKCRCHQVEEKFNWSISEKAGVSRDDLSWNSKTDDDAMLMSRYATRYVALKVMYFGKRFHGFASEAQMEPTVESEIFKALKKTRLLIGDKKQAKYSRCGRTDKGVSSVGQVIALFLRSKLKDIDASKKTPGNNNVEEHIAEEIDYPKVLNRELPEDIRILGWCPTSDDFNARFSCMSREYKYFFWSDNMNVEVMESAAKKFIGEHDFSNFCKMDAANVHNYKRRISFFSINPFQMRFEGNHQLCAMTIKGSAFLWHQVRCMVAVLFMIGRGLESPDIIDELLDTDKIRRKPQYAMAAELPLVLHKCEFEGLKFICSSDAHRALRDQLEKEYLAYLLQAAIFREAITNSISLPNDQSPDNIPSPKKKASHIPLRSRPTEPSYEERRAKLERSKLRDC